MPDKTHLTEQAVIASSKTDWAAFDAITDDEAEAAARADPDAQPLPDGRTMHPLAKVKRLRWTLHLSQQELAARYHIPLDIILAWECYKAFPDAVANAFLDAISADPEGVAKALASSVAKSQAAE